MESSTIYKIRDLKTVLSLTSGFFLSLSFKQRKPRVISYGPASSLGMSVEWCRFMAVLYVFSTTVGMIALIELLFTNYLVLSFVLCFVSFFLSISYYLYNWPLGFQVST
jgi:hypothetical protein